MTVKTIARQQYQRLVDSAASCAGLRTPSEGWLRTVRKALGMSGAQLAKRMEVTRSRVAQAEQAELSGGATIKSMQAAAEAMGCRFVYAIVPEKRIEDIITAQARKKAMALVGTATTHMALESQTLPDDKIASEVELFTPSWRGRCPLTSGTINDGGDGLSGRGDAADPDEFGGLKFKHLTTREELDELEQANIESGLAMARPAKGRRADRRLCRDPSQAVVRRGVGLGRLVPAHRPEHRHRSS